MPETNSSSSSRRMNGVAAQRSCAKARGAARHARARGASLDEHARVSRTSTCRSCIASCASISARRPQRLRGSGATQDGAFHRTDEMTPRQFAARVCRPAARRLRVPGARPAAGNRLRADVYGGVPGQRGWRPAGDVSERRDGADEVGRAADARGGRAGLVRVRRRQADRGATSG